MTLRLLQLAQVNIRHPSTGSRIRNYHLATQLARVMNVTHVGFGDAGGMVNPSQGADRIRIRLVPREPGYTVAKLARGAFGRTPVTLLNFYDSAMVAVLAEELATFSYDTVLVEGIEMIPYLPVIRAAKNLTKCVVLDWHNIESEVVARHSHHAANPLYRLYMRHTARQLKRLENEVLDGCDLHLVTSERDREGLLRRRATANIMVVENGVDVQYFAANAAAVTGATNRSARRRIVFVGSMDYSANVDAVGYFIKKVWPEIHRTFASLVFTIVGRNPPEKIREMGRRPGVEVIGTVADVRPYYLDALAAVVPLRVAGGTRLKILEAMAAGVPVISTRVGAEGLRVQPQRDLLLAESPREFQAQVARLWHDFSSWRRFSAAGRKLVEGTYDWNTIGARLTEVYFSLLATRRVAEPQFGASARAR
jgi:polysaccharide biosynthesis protein PslH